MDIAERNRLRAAAGLPLLHAAAETIRLQAVRQEAEFEAVWNQRKPEFQNWIEEGQGFLSKMGRWSISKQQVRRELRESHTD